MGEATTETDSQSLGVSLDRLLAAYRDVERRSLSLPAFSFLPFGIFLWNLLKFELCLTVDAFLLLPVYLPMYLVVFIRNRLPGKKWRYRCLSIKYIRYACRWVWRGEAPTCTSLVVRKLVNLVLKMHFRASLGLLRGRVELEDSLATEERKRLRSRIEEALDLWGGREIPAAYGYLIPGAALLLGLWNAIQRQSGQSSTISTDVLTYIAFCASFWVVVSTLALKRGLMLGGCGRSAYFPGALEGQGAYAQEQDMFRRLGISNAEIPLDILATLLTIPLAFWLIPDRILYSGYYLQKYLSQRAGLPAPPKPNMLGMALIEFAALVLLSWLTLARRTLLQRR